MTKTERAKLRRAIKFLFAEENRYEEGMVILCRLAGIVWPAGEAFLRGDFKSVTLQEIMKGEEPL